MNLKFGRHLAYCTNIHRGESWAEIFRALQEKTLAVRRQVCPDAPYAIGLRLGERAARELSDATALAGFRHWLDTNGCYVFTINGFPYGPFHGAPVKRQVYTPDWTSPARLEYTNQLFDLLADLLPAGMDGSVSTVPGSFKAFIRTPEQERAMRDSVWRCVEHVHQLSERTGRHLHLGLEPEPLCYLETSAETVRFFDQLRAEHHGDDRLERHLGVNYDACHLAVEFEEPRAAIRQFQESRVLISKLHLSSALKVRPTPEARRTLGAFADAVYLHQVIVRQPDGSLTRHEDLPLALQTATARNETELAQEEWRIHFHVPLHSRPTELFDTTADHLTGLLDLLPRQPGFCAHLEMETYTWEVLPPELKKRDVVDQLVAEYAWTLEQLRRRGLV